MDIVRPLMLANARMQLESCGLFLGTVALLGFGAWLIWQARKWRDQTRSEACAADEISLETYRQMMEDGELAPEEFEKIRDRMENRQTGFTASPPNAHSRSSPDSDAIRPGPPD